MVRGGGEMVREEVRWFVVEERWFVCRSHSRFSLLFFFFFFFVIMRYLFLGTKSLMQREL